MSAWTVPAIAFAPAPPLATTYPVPPVEDMVFPDPMPCQSSTMFKYVRLTSCTPPTSTTKGWGWGGGVANKPRSYIYIYMAVWHRPQQLHVCLYCFLPARPWTTIAECDWDESSSRVWARKSCKMLQNQSQQMSVVKSLFGNLSHAAINSESRC